VAEPVPSQPVSEERLRRWHRLFGLLLTDHLANSPFTVVLEMDLSQKQQLLDVVIVQRGTGRLTRPLPDGLDDLVAHNLITFKSHREPLGDWALKELTGHYVNYRKQVSPRGRLLAEDQFRLYAVCARQPRDLFAAVPPAPLRPGVYTCRRGTDAIRVVVAAELPREERNALLHLFSAAPEQVQYAVEHYRLQSADLSATVAQLFEDYKVEGLDVPYTREDFRRDFLREHMHELTAEERLAGLQAKDLLAHLSPEERLAGLSAEQIEAYLKGLRTRPAAPKNKKPKRRN
jgi:hypothetical protein